MAEKKTNDFHEVMESLLGGMNSLLSSKTVVGQPQTFGDCVIIPLVDVSLGAGAGSSVSDKKGGGAGGFSAKLSPSAVLIIKNGVTKVVNIKNQDAVTKAMDLVPDIINKIMAGKERNKMPEDQEALDIAFPEDDS